jgi:hypothetical protein
MKAGLNKMKHEHGELDGNCSRIDNSRTTQLLTGKTNKEVAVARGCSVRTVDLHVANVVRWAGVLPSRYLRFQ